MINGEKYCKSRNLLDFEALKTAPSGEFSNIPCDHVLALTLKPNTIYTCISDGQGSETGDADSNRSVYINGAVDSSGAAYTVFANHPVTVTSTGTGYVKIGLFSQRTNAAQYINGSARIWLIEGSDSTIPYEPYGNIWTDVPIPTRKYVNGAWVDISPKQYVNGDWV